MLAAARCDTEWIDALPVDRVLGDIRDPDSLVAASRGGKPSSTWRASAPGT